MPSVPVSRTPWRIAVAVAVSVVVVVALPLTTMAGHFSDVPDTHPFHDEIAWLSDNGITTGFGDGTFRPGDPVTRMAMAAFMMRLSGHAPGVPPVVHAALADEVADGSITGSSLGTITKRTSTLVSVGTGDTGTANVSCEPGEIRLSGGGGFLGGEMNASISFSGDAGPAGNWRIHARNDSGVARNLEAQVFCLEP